MNENLGATRMANSVADELHGTMGSRVKPGEWFGGSKGYRFPYYNWNTHDPSRLVLVDDSAKLDPDSGSSRVTVRFRTGAVGSNIVQKGQNGTYTNAAGATIYHQLFKIDLEQGVPVCMFQSACPLVDQVGNRRQRHEMAHRGLRANCRERGGDLGRRRNAQAH